MADDATIARLERRAARERQARKAAEALLEERSKALWEANQALERARSELETRVAERTEEMQRALRLAEDASAAKTRFLAHMSHELRTPLTSIIGYTADLLEHEPDHDDLVTIDRNARHLLGLINDVLDLARIEAGGLQIHARPTPLRDLLTDLEQIFSPRAEARGLRFRVSVDTDVPEAVEVDGLRLRQVLLNLLSNAVKFTDRGTVALRLFRPDPIAPHTLRFDVLDTGRGIPATSLTDIFEPFRQVAGGDEAQGAGLGLAICRRIARKLGGELTATSTEGRGSCFTLVVHAPPCPSPDAPPQTVDHQERPLRGLHLLLAEDAADSRTLLRRWCVRAGARVTAVADGRAAIEHADDTVDLVLMDMQMPVLDGYQATRRLRSQGFTRPIVALTAHTMAEDRQTCHEAGCDGYLSKPIGRRALLQAVLDHLAS